MKISPKSLLIKFGVPLFFVFYAMIGILIYSDFGCGPDEGMERQTSLVNYKYVLETLRLSVKPEVTTWLGYLPPLLEYRDRFYGTAVQLPMVLIESAAMFKLEPAQYYGLRHLYNFVIFYCAMICFYLILKKRINHRGLALTGTAMLILTPRFFAESFYNNKDILFLSWYIFSYFFLLRWLEKRTAVNALAAGVVLAFTVNTRMNGIALLPIAGLIVLVQAFQHEHRAVVSKITLKSGLILLGAFAVTFWLITPVYWEHPLRSFQEALAFNLSHPNHGSDGNLFMGQLVDSTKVWYYLPVWIVLTVPTLYLFFAAAGFFRMIVKSIRAAKSSAENEHRSIDFLLTAGGLLPLAIIILFRVTVYNGWRHCYFVYPSLIYLACLGIQALWGQNSSLSFFPKVRRTLTLAGIALVMLGNLYWIVQNHPYQFAYFAPIFRQYAPLFSGDTWGIASRAMLEHIAETDSRTLITVNHAYTISGSINRGLLPEADRNRLDLVYESENADYILFSRDDKTSAQASFPDFEKTFSIRVDQDEIGIVFKRKDE